MFDFDNTDNLPPFGEDVRDSIDNGDIVGLRRALDKGGGINIWFGKYQATPLHFASKKHSLEIVEELCKRGADINAKDRINDRPLHEATRFGEQSILSFLLEQNADPNVQNNYGDSPLMYCFDTTRYRKNGWTKKARILLKHNADKDMRNHHGKAAIDHLLSFLERIQNGISIENEIRNPEELAEVYHLYDVLTGVSGKGEQMLLDVLQSLQKCHDKQPEQIPTCHGQNFKEMCETALSLLKTRDWTLPWELLDDLPSEIHELGTITEDMFLRSLETKQVQPKYIRLMIVGDVGVGKTSLCLNLFGENETACPTDGINVFIQNYQVDMKTGKWKKLSTEDTNNLQTKILSTVCRDKATTGNGSAAKTTTGNINITDTTTVNRNVTETTTINRNVQETSIGNILETTKEKEKTEIEMIYTRVPQEVEEGLDSSSSRVKRRRVDSEKTRDILKGINTCGIMAEDDALLSVWDFAGDEIYEATHHIFMSPDAVYIIVFNTADCLTEESNLDKLYTWQEVIRTYSTSSAEGSSKTPPVILVGTHLDQMGTTEDERNSNKTKFFEKMEQHCSQNVQQLFFVDNTNGKDPAFQRIRDEIATSAKYQQNWNKRIPATWVTLDRDLRMMKQQKRFIVRFSDVLDIDKRNEISIGNPEEIKTFLMYMHLTGNILFFEHELQSVADHEPVIVTHPQWIVDAFRCIIKAMRFVETHDVEITKHQIIQFHKSGILTVGLLQRLLVGYADHQEILIEIMQRLDLLVVVGDATEERSWIVPSMLKKKEDSLFLGVLSHKSAVLSKTLCYVFKSKVLFALYDKLLARCLSSKFSIKKNAKGEALLQRGSVCLELSRACDLLLSCGGAVVSVTLVIRNKDKHFRGKGVFVRKLVSDILKDILSRFHHTNLTYELCLHCTDRICNDHCPVPISDVRTEGTVLCCEDSNEDDHWLDRADTDIWMGQSQEELNKGFQLPTKVLNSPATSQMLAVLSNEFIGSKYQIFFMYLGLDSTTIDSHATRSDCHISSVIVQLFTTWMNKNGEQATVREILTAMKTMDLDHSRAAQKLKELSKT